MLDFNFGNLRNFRIKYKDKHSGSRAIGVSCYTTFCT